VNSKKLTATHIIAIESELLRNAHFLGCWCRIFWNVLLWFGNLRLLRLVSMDMVVCYIHFFPDLGDLVKHLVFAQFLTFLSLIIVDFLHIREICEVSRLVWLAEVLIALLSWMIFLIKFYLINWRIKSFSLKTLGLHLVNRLTIWWDIRNLTIVIWNSKRLEDGILLQEVMSKSLWWQHKIGVLVDSNLIKKPNILFY